MGIRTDDDLTRSHQSFVRQQRMFNAHASHFKIVGDIMFPGKITHLFTQGRGLNVFAGRKMIRYQRDFIFIKNRAPDSFKLNNRRRTGNVVRQNQIHLGDQQIPSLHKFPAHMHGENFLCHCHAHKKPLLINQNVKM